MAFDPDKYPIGLIPERFRKPRITPPRGMTAEEWEHVRAEARAGLSKPEPGPAPVQDMSDLVAAAPRAQEPAPIRCEPAASTTRPAGSAAQAPGREFTDEQHRFVRSRYRHACNWLELFHICTKARCRHAGRCRGEPVACLRAGVRLAPAPARKFVRSMMRAQERGLSFEEAFENAADYHDGYFSWLAGLAAKPRRSR